MNGGIRTYQEHAVATQTRGRLVVLLYDGAIKFLEQAKNELAAGHFAEKGASSTWKRVARSPPTSADSTSS